MYIVITVSLIAILLTYWDVQKVISNGMMYAFCLLAILYGLHYDYGTDYMQYLYEYENVVNSNYNITSVLDPDNWRNGEFGWGLLQWFFAFAGKNGFFILIALLGIFENAVIYHFITKYLDKKYWIFAVFVYVFSASFYLMGFSMIRQWFAMCLFMFAYNFSEQKKWLPALLIIYVASTIHHTASFLIPFAFWGYLPTKYTKVYTVAILCSFVLLICVGEVVNSALSILMANSDTIEDYIDNYSNIGEGRSFGLGFILNTIPFIVTLLCVYKRGDNLNSRLLLLACIGTMIVAFSQSLAMVKRMSLYFTLLNIVSIPIAYNAISNKVIRNALIVIFIFMQLVGYAGFLNDDTYNGKFDVFKTIFTQL